MGWLTKSIVTKSPTSCMPGFSLTGRSDAKSISRPKVNSCRKISLSGNQNKPVRIIQPKKLFNARQPTAKGFRGKRFPPETSRLPEQKTLPYLGYGHQQFRQTAETNDGRDPLRASCPLWPSPYCAKNGWQ